MRWKHFVWLMVLVMVGMAFPGCTKVWSPTSNEVSAAEKFLKSNTAQNAQVWPDGSASLSSAQPFGGNFTLDGFDVISTGPNGAFGIGSGGVMGLSPGDVNADRIYMDFFEPLHLDDGRVWSPPKTVTIEGFSSGKSPVIQATTEQVALWTDVLKNLSDDQKEAVIAALERDKVITTEVAGLLRESLGLLTP